MRTREMYFSHYGITKAESKELLKKATFPENRELVKRAAEMANPMLKNSLILSMSENLSYDKVDRRMCIWIKNDDFYGYRRKALYYFKQMLIDRKGVDDE